MSKIYDLAVIGGGPAGIASAVEASVLGLKDIVLFEKGANHSTTIRTFYKDNKRVDRDWKGQKVVLEGSVHFMDGTKESTLELFDALIGSHAIDTRFNTEISAVIPNDPFEIHTASGELFKARNAIIAIGYMSKPNKPDYALPVTLRDRIHFNLDAFSANETVLVVGGGNSAAEYAHFLSDQNAVTLTYRRDKFTRLNPINESIIMHHAGIGKIRLKLGVDILGLNDEGGRVCVRYADGESEVFDRVVYALGGMLPLDFLKKCRIDLDENNIAKHDEFYQTTTPRLYVAGDIIAKIGGSIAASLNHAAKIVNHIKSGS
ncbi:MAG: NAD(P)-binding domain-containing protein [Helicobacteraceae bacterium]|jgi:thioredoxin reductase (NADPH)|nr:NAD(P)-binding domain-containing protein [Helicobacteraceae bacterium]